MTSTSLDFAYPWWLNYGHLTVAFVSGVSFAVVWFLRWPRWSRVMTGIVTLWALAAAVVMQTFNAGGVPTLPTEAFLRSNPTARVLDIGAGTGRSSIMVLRERPSATLVAFDQFGDSFAHHFGDRGRPQDRLLANLRAAGVDERASIDTGDMRALPFADNTFDAIVSAYTMEHVGGDDARLALAEAHRVLTPGGEFLLILVNNDAWMKLAFGPVLTHGGLRGPDWWADEAGEAGFVVTEQGRRVGTLFLLLTKHP